MDAELDEIDFGNNEAAFEGRPITRRDAELGENRKPPEQIFLKPSVRRDFVAELGDNFIDIEAAQARIEEWTAESRRVGETGENDNKAVISLFDFTGSWSQPSLHYLQT